MAIPLLAHGNPSGYRSLLASKGASADLADAERGTYGWDHADVAGWLSETWDFPEPLKNAIIGHHGGEGPTAVCITALLDDGAERDDIVERARTSFGIKSDAIVAALVRGAEDSGPLALLLAPSR